MNLIGNHCEVLLGRRSHRLPHTAGHSANRAKASLPSPKPTREANSQTRRQPHAARRLGAKRSGSKLSYSCTHWTALNRPHRTFAPLGRSALDIFCSSAPTRHFGQCHQVNDARTPIHTHTYTHPHTTAPTKSLTHHRRRLGHTNVHTHKRRHSQKTLRTTTKKLS